MTKSYLRPLGLVYGPDAREPIASGEAGALGGMDHIGFTSVEIITRDGAKIDRRRVRYGELAGDPRLAAFILPRPAFAGVAMTETRLMGIVNVTPDSFSDGGQFSSSDQAIQHGERLAQEGAVILDVGGESTRPGSEAVAVEDELSRVIPVIEDLSARHIVSADTRKASVMRAAATAGAKIVNDVSALGFDTESIAMVRSLGLPVILMHAQGEPKTMQLSPKYDDVALDVYDFLEEKIDVATRGGIPRALLAIDPGIGFGKTFRHNLDVMRQLSLFHGLGVTLLVGLSRKAFVGALTGEKSGAGRAAGSAGGAVQAAMMGCHILRVHDVKVTADALNVFTAALNPDSVEL